MSKNDGGPAEDCPHPDGKKCRDCEHFVRRCSWLLSYTGDETRCSWIPSRFRPMSEWTRSVYGKMLKARKQ